jgi:hypothetical protein
MGGETHRKILKECETGVKAAEGPMLTGEDEGVWGAVTKNSRELVFPAENGLEADVCFRIPRRRR